MVDQDLQKQHLWQKKLCKRYLSFIIRGEKMLSLNKSFLEIFFSKLKSFDWLIIFLILIISLISLLVLSSLDFNNQNLVEKHFIRIIFSFFIFLLTASISMKFWYKNSYLFYGIVIIL